MMRRTLATLTAQAQRLSRIAEASQIRALTTVSSRSCRQYVVCARVVAGAGS
jgi:hypothetical protein